MVLVTSSDASRASFSLRTRYGENRAVTSLRVTTCCLRSDSRARVKGRGNGGSRILTWSKGGTSQTKLSQGFIQSPAH
jgi:hypothetical protein